MSKHEERVVKIHFHFHNTLVHTQSEWAELGGYRGFLKLGGFSIRQIEKVEYTTMPIQKLYSLKEWEP